MPHPWSRILRAYGAGASEADLLRRYGVHASTFRRHLDRIGHARRSPKEARALRGKRDAIEQERRLRRQLPRAAVIRAYLKGEGLRPLAARHDVSVAQVRQRLCEWDVPIRAPGERTFYSRAYILRGRDARSKVVALYRTLGSATQAARALGLDKSTVLRALRRWARL